MKERDQISKKVEDSAANGRGFIGVARLEHGGVEAESIPTLGR